MIGSALTKRHKIAIGFLFLSTLVWGAAGPVIKYTLNSIPPFTFLFLRFLVASVISIPFLAMEEQKHPVDKRDWVNLVILSFLGGTLTLSLAFLGFELTTSLDGSLLSSISPLIILVASANLLKEKITKNQKIGTAIALFGSLLIVVQPLLEGYFQHKPGGLTQILGNVLIILSIVAWTAYTIWSKRVFDPKPSKLGRILHYLHLRPAIHAYSPFFLVGVLSVVSLLTTGPLAYMEIASGKTPRAPTPNDVSQSLIENFRIPEVPSELVGPVLGILYMGIFSTLVAYGLYEWALKELPAAETSVYGYLQPLFAIPFAYLLLGEKVSLWFVLGGAVIAVGVYVSETKKNITIT